MNIRDVLIIGAIVFGLGGVLYLLGGQAGYRWYESYEPGTEQPYQTGILEERLRQLAEEEFTKVDVGIDSILRQHTGSGQTYFFVGKKYFADSSAQRALLGFVARGNTAFLSSNKLPFELIEQLEIHACEGRDLTYSEVEDTLMRAFLMHPDLSGTENAAYVDYSQPGMRRPYDWKYMADASFCDESEFTPLGYIATPDTLEYVNFARQSYGAGTIYLHTTPLALTNYHLLPEGGQRYVDALLTHLPARTVIYDRESRQPDLFSFLDNDGSAKRDTPLRFILQQPALSWAWYLLLAGIALYLIFRAKRRQRIIPVLPTNRNTSLEYIQTVGRLYFLQENHKKLALQQVKILLQFIHERYGLATSRLDDKFFANLAVRSEVPREHIEATFRLYQNIRSSGFVSDNTLTRMHQLIERFYQDS